jgi:hypothetical protein
MATPTGFEGRKVAPMVRGGVATRGNDSTSANGRERSGTEVVPSDGTHLLDLLEAAIRNADLVRALVIVDELRAVAAPRPVLAAVP